MKQQITQSFPLLPYLK